MGKLWRTDDGFDGRTGGIIRGERLREGKLERCRASESPNEVRRSESWRLHQFVSGQVHSPDSVQYRPDYRQI